jgi:small subunit ribosomal protein S2
MRTITLEELLEAGCHFGHQVTRHNPKSRDFVFEARDNIHIIDLEKTKEGLENAAKFVKSVAEKPGATMVMLGAKRQAEGVVKEEAKRAGEAGAEGLYTITARWIGGTLTNSQEVAKNYKKLKELTSKLHNELERAKYTKKEISLWEKERQKLLMYYDGAKDMAKTPDIVFVIDTHLEDLAVREAIAMRVPVVGIVDTNADPDLVKYPIPANDDAVGSIKIITSYIMDAWIEGKKKGASDKAKGEEQAAKDEAAKTAKSEGQMAKGSEQGEKKEEPKKTEVKKEEPKKSEPKPVEKKAVKKAAKSE